MASTHKSLRSSTANKRPTTSIADGQIALNTNTTSPGLFFKDSTGATIIKVGPVHVGTTAPNASPAAGGSSGNSTGEVWLDTSLTPNGVKIWNGASWTNATPIGSTTVQGLLELATNAETQTGTDPDRAVTPAGLQSKVSDSTSTTSSTTIASSTAVKSAYDLANAALPKSGGTVTGNLEIGTTGSLSFEGATADAFETTIAVVDPTADRTITLPDTTGTVVTTGDTGTVTSTMIADGTIVDGDISASAEIAVSKLADGAARQLLQTDAAGTGVEWASNIDVPGTLDVTSTATFDSIASHPLGSAAAPTLTFTGDTNTGIYSPGADQVAISTGGSGRLFVDASGNVGVGAAPSTIVDSTQSAAAAYSSWTLRNTAADGYVQQQFLVGAAGANGQAQIGYAPGIFFALGPVANDTTTPIVFRNNNGTERLRITSAGLVGVGVSAPGGLFHVGPSGAGVIVDNTYSELAPPSSGNDSYIFRSSNDGSLNFSSRPGAGGRSYRFWRGSNVSMIIDDSGRVGIGTSAPLSTLTVSDSTATNGTITLGNNASYNGQINYTFSTGELRISQVGGGSLGTTFYTNGSERLRIDSSGRVGIGTTSPGSELVVTKSSGNVRLTVQGGTNGDGTLALAGAGTGIGKIAAWDQLVFGKSSGGAGDVVTEWGRWDSSGRLLVGTSSSIDGNTVQVVNNVTSFRFADNSGSSGFACTHSRNATPGLHTIVQNGDQLGYVSFRGSDGTQFLDGAFILASVDGTPGVNDMPGRLTFHTTADGASSSTERMRINSDGAITFQNAGASLSSGVGFKYNANATNPNLGLVIDSNDGNTSHIHLYNINATNNGYRFYVKSNGGISNFSANNTNLSDRNVKKDIAPAAGTWDCIKEWEIVNYRYKDQPDDADLNLGVIAQQVAESCPEVITVFSEATEDEPEKLGVKEQQMYWMAIKALQEAQIRIEALEAEVAALKAQ